jgi:PncC family amidohydrolase
MEQLTALAQKIAILLKARGDTLGVAESSTGGLLSASLLAVPGASAYFAGAAVVYTGVAREGLMNITAEALRGTRSATEAYAALLARTVRERLSTTWGLAESGAAGPTGNRYGDAAGHSCLAVSGPIEHAITVETGRSDRLDNMFAFSLAALNLLLKSIDKA